MRPGAGTGTQPRKRPPRSRPIAFNFDLDLDLDIGDDFAPSDPPAPSSCSTESFEANIIQSLNRSLYELKRSYIAEFQHLLAASCSYDRVVGDFVSQLRAEVRELIRLPEALISSDSLNSTIDAQFNQLRVPAAITEIATTSDPVDVLSFHKGFVASTTDLLEQFASGRAEIQRTFEPAISHNWATKLELQSLAVQQEFVASWLESRLQKLKTEKKLFHERQMAELCDHSSQAATPLDESIGNLRSQIRTGRGQAAQRKTVALTGIARDVNRELRRATDHLMFVANAAQPQQDLVAVEPVKMASRDTSWLKMARERLKVLQMQREEAEREFGSLQ
jgi:hypothetical protein